MTHYRSLRPTKWHPNFDHSFIAQSKLVSRILTAAGLANRQPVCCYDNTPMRDSVDRLGEGVPIERRSVR